MTGLPAPPPTRRLPPPSLTFRCAACPPLRALHCGFCSCCPCNDSGASFASFEPRAGCPVALQLLHALSSSCVAPHAALKAFEWQHNAFFLLLDSCPSLLPLQRHKHFLNAFRGLVWLGHPCSEDTCPISGAVSSGRVHVVQDYTLSVQVKRNNHVPTKLLS